MRRRRNAERNGNQKFKDSSDRSDEKGSSQSIGIKYFRQNGTLTDKAVAEVQMANVDNPIKITADDISVQTIRLVHLLNKFFADRRPRRVER